jgi:hypothetical protein
MDLASSVVAELRHIGSLELDVECRATLMGEIAISGYAILMGTPALRSDRDVAIAAVSSDAGVLEYLDAGVRDDRDVVCAAVRQNGASLRFASDRLRGAVDIVSTAVRGRAYALKWAAETVSNEASAMLPLLRDNGMLLEYAGPHVTRDEQCVICAVSCVGKALEFAHSSIRANPRVCFAAIRNDPAAGIFAAPTLRSDPLFRILLSVVRNPDLAESHTSHLDKWQRDAEEHAERAVELLSYISAAGSEATFRHVTEVVRTLTQPGSLLAEKDRRLFEES